MYLSSLLIDVGENPDRPRPGRLWLRNLYHVHQRLCMAFPSESRKFKDEHFLQPYEPEDFGEGHAHVERGPDSGFLFRIDPGSCGRAMILVQSAAEPDWDYAFHNARHLLAAPPQVKLLAPSYSKGQRLRFRIRIGLCDKKKTSTGGTDLRKYSEGKDKYGRRKSQSKRVALSWDKDQNPQDVIREWLARKGEKCGFEIDSGTFRAVQIGWSNGLKRSGDARNSNARPCEYHMKFRFALLEGRLSVTDETKFRSALLHGLGSGKAFGFGLLSVAGFCGLPAVGTL